MVHILRTHLFHQFMDFFLFLFYSFRYLCYIYSNICVLRMRECLKATATLFLFGNLSTGIHLTIAYTYIIPFNRCERQEVKHSINFHSPNLIIISHISNKCYRLTHTLSHTETRGQAI